MTRSVFQRYARKETGDAIPSAQITVVTSGGGVADIYTGEIGGTPVSQPLLSDANGYFIFYVDAGVYDVTATDPVTLSAATFTREEIGSARTSLIDDDQSSPAYSLLNPPPSADLINDLSQEYIFDTVAAYKAFATAFPVGKRVYIKDINRYYAVTASIVDDIGERQITSDVFSTGLLIEPPQNTTHTTGQTYVYDMAQQAIKNTGVNTGDTNSDSAFTLTGASSEGDFTLSATGNNFRADQLIGYLASDGDYYSAKVKVIGDTVTLYESLPVGAEVGSDIFAFYKNTSHPSVRGYRCIADDILRTERFYEQAWDLGRLKYTAVSGSVTDDTLATNTPDNCGSSQTPATRILFNVINSTIKSNTFQYRGGEAVFRFTINTNGADIQIRINDNDTIATYLYDEVVNTEYPTLVEIPLRKKDDSSMSIDFKNVSDATADINFKMTGLFSSIGQFDKDSSGTHYLLGDSWFEQEGIYERFLEKMPNATIINGGVGGRTSTNLANAVYSEVEQYKPDYVHVMCGTNDALTGGGVSTSGFHKWMYLCEARLKDIGADPIMYTPSQGGTDSPQWLEHGRGYLHDYRYFKRTDEKHSEVFTVSFASLLTPASSEVFCVAACRTIESVRVLDAFGSGINNLKFGFSTGVSVPTLDVVTKSGNSVIGAFDVDKSDNSSRYFTVSCENTTGGDLTANGFVTFEIYPIVN